MSERLYYHNSFLHDFTASVKQVIAHDGRRAIILDRTAFYPTSGGQLFDTGTLELNGQSLQVQETAENDSSDILHFVGESGIAPEPGSAVHGKIDSARRRDHMQQHSGQHVLSAAFVRLCDAPTVSFHMGAESCTIDLAAKALASRQIEEAEKLANQVTTEDRPVEIRFASADEARALGVRKLPPFETEGGKYRLIDIQDFDLTACGGTHVARTGQIGAILLRKTENVKPGIRVEFVCGDRATATARRDFAALTQAADIFSTHIWEVPGQVRKSIEEAKAAHKTQQLLLEELAELHASKMLAEAQAAQDTHVIARVFPDRDAAFVKLLAQKIARAGKSVTLLASTAGEPTLIFAQTPELPFNMGALMKQAVSELGGRGGGGKDFAQGGVPDTAKIQQLLNALAESLKR